MNPIFDELYALIQDRQRRPRPHSYTSALLAAGEDRILQKVGEEAVEVILAAKGQGRQRLLEELADLTYHLLVLLVAYGVTFDDLAAELARRRRHQGPAAAPDTQST